MKITGIQAVIAGNVQQIAVAAELPLNEALDPNDISRLLDIIREAAGGEKQPPIDNDHVAPGATQFSEAEIAANPTGRRSRRSSGAEQPSTSESAPAADTAAPGRRRRSSGAAPEPTPEAEAPLGRRRRSSTAAGTAEPSGATPAAATAPASTEGRRRRGAAPAPTEISDADLSKAASECARICTPNVVKDILKSFHVEKVGDIKEAERQEFLDECQGAIKEAEGE